MEFRNPENGYTESRSAPWLWTLLFGGFYFAAIGLWTPFVLWILIAIALVALLHVAGMLLMTIVWLVFAVMAPNLVRNSYLRRGWVEVSSSADSPLAGRVEVPNRTASPPTAATSRPSQVGSEYRRCPFCAEEIRIEAIKCKHCGSAVEPAPRVGGQRGSTTSASDDEQLMARYGITRDGNRYAYKEHRYYRLSEAVNFAKLKEAQARED